VKKKSKKAILKNKELEKSLEEDKVWFNPEGSETDS
jgi:hypothetical protein